jgi:alanine racemase
MHKTATARVDLSALVDNLAVVRRLCPRSRVMAMIKADGYGHGLIPVAKTLSRADGLGVARLQEALALRDAGIARRILLVATLLSMGDLAVCSEQNIDVTAHDHTSVSAITAAPTAVRWQSATKPYCGGGENCPQRRSPSMPRRSTTHYSPPWGSG